MRNEMRFHRMRAFKIYHDPEVALWVKKLTVDFSNWYLNTVGVDHQITIKLHAAGAIATPIGRAMACFNGRGGKPCIWVATWWYYWRDDGRVRNRQEAYDEILDSLAHEFIHYEKWSRKIPSNHRGLQRRVNSLIRRFHEYRESGYAQSG